MRTTQAAAARAMLSLALRAAPGTAIRISALYEPKAPVEIKVTARVRGK